MGDLVDRLGGAGRRIAFSTRIGRIGEEFASQSEDHGLTRRALWSTAHGCAEVGADRRRDDGLAAARRDSRAPAGIVTPGTVYDHCDGLWSDAPGRAMVLLSADCMPIAIARADGLRPAVEILHAGWRGLLAGIVAAGVRALGSRTLAAAIGPSIGPCCYEVGEEVATPFRQAFGDDVVRDGKLDLWTSAERALRAHGVERVERTDVCTS